MFSHSLRDGVVVIGAINACLRVCEIYFVLFILFHFYVVLIMVLFS